MKKISLFKSAVIVGLLAVTAVGIQSCKKDEDPDRDKFIGAFKYNEACDGFLVTDYATTIAASSSGDEKVSITGFAGLQCGGSDIIVEGTISGNDITITPNQIFCTAQVLITSGSGTINDSGNSITITYSYTINGASGTCTGIYSKI